MEKLSMEQLDNMLARALENYNGSEVAKAVIAVLVDEINKRNEFKPFFNR